ncbi:restriction endonuclease subunit S, partial [Phocaeicola plebeius]|uniref:restriction endonuclease subunit S n=1 Tax=Phocaeicola plebeius TaxID=310297 RepID=UPI00402A400C
AAEREGRRAKGNVPNLRFPEFQEEWEKCRLGDVCTFLSGGTPKIDVKEYWNGTIPFVSAISMHDTYILDSKLHISEEGLKHGSRLLTKDNLLLLVRGSMLWNTIPICLNKNDVAFNQDVKGIIANDTINNEFLLYWLKSKEQRLKYMVTGTGLGAGKLDTSDLLSMIVYIPAMKEQDKVARLLSLFDERIATQNKIIDKLQSLIKGIRNDVYGKLRKSVGVNAMISDVLSYEQPQPYIVKDTEYTAEGIPVLTANKAFVLGYTSETDGIYDKGDCIIFDDFTLDCKYVDFPFKVKSSAIKILTAKNKELLRYTFEFLKYLDLSTEEHKRHYIAETQNQEFILPTEQIVKTIAHIFSTLSVRKETAVKQRNVFEKQKQYLLRQMFI